MSTAQHGNGVGRVEHAVFGCPGDLGFRLVDKSTSFTADERAALMGLSDQKSGPMLESEAVTVADLGRRFAVLVTHPDHTPGTRKGLVVTHVFLVSQEDYDAVGNDPLALLEPVRSRCRPELPTRADLAHDLPLCPAPRRNRLQSLPLDGETAAEVAPVVASALLAAVDPMVVPAEVAHRAIEPAIGMMPLARRRSFTFATADFSRDASKQALVGSLEPVRSRGKSTSLLREIEWLLMQSADVAASIAERLDRCWPEGAAEKDLVRWLRARRKLYELEQSDDYKQILETADSIVRSWDGDHEELFAAGRLVGRALTLEGTFVPKQSKRVVGLLQAAAGHQLTEPVLAAAGEKLDQVGPSLALRGRALLAGWCERNGVSPETVRKFDRDLAASLEHVDPALADSLEWVLDSDAPCSIEQLQAIEWFGWRAPVDSLRETAAAEIAGVLEGESELFEAQVDLLFRILGEGQLHWVEWWFQDQDRLDAFEVTSILDSLLKAARPGKAREKAVELALNCLADADLNAHPRVTEWLGPTSDRCADLIFDRVAGAAKPPAAATRGLQLLRGLLAVSGPDASIRPATELLDRWLQGSQAPPERKSEPMGRPEGQSWFRWLWPFNRPRERGPAVKARTNRDLDYRASNRWIWIWILVVVMAGVAVGVAVLVELGGRTPL